METIPQVLEKSIRDFPSRPAIIFGDTVLTYEKLGENIKRFALALQYIGVKKGDRVAIHLPNCPQFVIATYGALEAGAIVVPCSSAYKEMELKYQVEDSGASVLITHEKLLPVASRAASETTIRHVIVTYAQDYLYLSDVDKAPRVEGDRYIPMMRLLQEHEPKPSPVTINPKEDLAFLCYTGGTTGVPKGCMLTHFNCVVDQLHEIFFYQLRRGEEVLLLFLPLYHIYGLNRCMGTYLAAAATIVLHERFDATRVLEAIQRYKVTVVTGVPTVYNALINHPKIKDYDLSSVRIWKSAAAPLPTSTWARFKELVGASIVIGWGLTEAGPGLTLTPLDIKEYKPGMIGIPEIDTEVAVFDPETNAELPVGAVGELRARGPQIMKGYWNKPEETAKVFLNGWLCTGDLGYMDEDGMFYFVDRLKDVIKVSGFQVWPTEIEDVLCSHPAVLEAAVIGIPDEYHGEVPKAYVVLRSEYRGKVAKEELIKYCEERLAKYKVPREIEFINELPKTSSGKILKRKLREMTQ